MTLRVFPKAKCFMKCIMEKEGIFDKDGNVVMEYVEKNMESLKLPDDKKNYFKDCVAKSNHVKTCEDSVNLLQCFVKYSDDALV
ncbi:hypothetical protein WA026_015302 [Henosepilachna vigintioctopunctata]|uniref:Uncharacterized protein n=1 Tax=Henosepilachna vigintioctopunctata TaxID=420089 RepID=A0AAW1TKZ3_9CUCU